MSNTISQFLLPEFDHEMAVLKQHLALVPEHQVSFRPHARSMTLGRLAGHLVEIPRWAVFALAQDEFHLNPPGEPEPDRFHLTNRAEALERFDQILAEARAAIAAATDEEMVRPWTFKKAGKTVLTMPKITVLRTFTMNHMIHHRAQLGVYLRLLDIPIPGSYGPSADTV